MHQPQVKKIINHGVPLNLELPDKFLILDGVCFRVMDNPIYIPILHKQQRKAIFLRTNSEPYKQAR